MIGIFSIGNTIAYARSTTPGTLAVFSGSPYPYSGEIEPFSLKVRHGGVQLAPPLGFAVTHFKVAREAGASFVHTAGPLVYANIFNERLGVGELGGFTYMQKCTPGAGIGAAGLLNILYARHGLAQGAIPIYIWSLGGGVFGYLRSCVVVASVEHPGLLAFGMSLGIV